MIARILLALDASERAPSVVAAAAEFGSRFGATLIPFRALSFPQDFPAAGGGSPPDLLPAHLVEEAKQDLTRLVATLSDVKVEAPVVQFGEAARAIIAAADSLDADMIALGSHGFRGWDHVLGTTASTVANRAACHVLVVRPALRST